MCYIRDHRHIKEKKKDKSRCAALPEKLLGRYMQIGKL